MGCHCCEYHRSLRQCPPTDRRVIQIGVCHQLQQPLHCLVAEELQPYLRWPGYVARLVYPSVFAGNHSSPIVCLRSNDCQRRPEPGIQKADIRRFIVTEDYFADCHRRFLWTYRRLVVHFRYPCKNRCRWWCDGCDARSVRYLSLCPSNWQCR